MQQRRLIIVLVTLALLSCGSPTGPTYNGIPLPTPQPRRDLPTPPPVWLIISERAVLGSLAAGGSRDGHGDPQMTIPDIATVILPMDARLVVVVGSNTVTEFRATARPWRADGGILPLIDDTAQQLPAERRQEGSLTIFSVQSLGDVSDQLLNVYVTFSVDESWGYYLWRVKVM